MTPEEVLANAAEVDVDVEYAVVWTERPDEVVAPAQDSLEIAQWYAQHVLRDPEARRLLGGVARYVKRTTVTASTAWEAA